MYCNRDLVKRHERTIHAELYNARYDQADTANKDRDGGGDSTTFRVPARSRTDPECQSISTNSNITVAILDDLPALTEAAPVLSRATPLGGSEENMADTADAAPSPCAAPSLSRALSIPSFLPHDTINLNGSEASSSMQHGRSASTVITQTAELPEPSCPVPSSSNLDFSISDLMAASPFTMNDTSISTSDFTITGHDRNKRQRLSMDVSSMQVLPNDRVYSPSLLLPTVSRAENPHYLTDPLDINLVMGGVSEEFFFHQITQQQERTSIPVQQTDNNFFGTVDSSAITAADTVNVSRTDHFTEASSETGTERTERIRLPMILQEKSENPPRLSVDENAFQALFIDYKQRSRSLDVQFPLKSSRELQHFLNGYLDCFHRHLPILHLPTLKLSEAPSPLILAMCCIGALYRLERQKARRIYQSAAAVADTLHMKNLQSTYPAFDLLASSEDPGIDHTVTAKPLWFSQARTLLLLFAVLGDDSATTQTELGKIGVFITVSIIITIRCLAIVES